MEGLKKQSNLCCAGQRGRRVVPQVLQCRAVTWLEILIWGKKNHDIFHFRFKKWGKSPKIGIWMESDEESRGIGVPTFHTEHMKSCGEIEAVALAMWKYRGFVKKWNSCICTSVVQGFSSMMFPPSFQVSNLFSGLLWIVWLGTSLSTSSKLRGSMSKANMIWSLESLLWSSKKPEFHRLTFWTASVQGWTMLQIACQQHTRIRDWMWMSSGHVLGCDLEMMISMDYDGLRFGDGTPVTVLALSIDRSAIGWFSNLNLDYK